MPRPHKPEHGAGRADRPNSVGSRARLWFEGFGPYQSLAMVAVPVGLVEPLKLVAVALLGEGHWIAGSGMIAAAYVVCLLPVERLIILFKPKLLKLRWIARLWASFVIVEYRLLTPLRRAGAR
jgi:hypothetical protein